MQENIKIEDILYSIENVSDNYQRTVSNSLLVEKIEETKFINQGEKINEKKPKTIQDDNKERVCNIEAQGEIWGNKESKILVLGSSEDIEFSSTKKLWNDILTLGMKFTDNDVCCIKSNKLRDNDISKYECILALGESEKIMLEALLKCNLENSKINTFKNVKIMPTFNLEKVKTSGDTKKAFWQDLKVFLKAI